MTDTSTWPNTRGAGVAVVDVLVEAVAVEQARGRGGGARRQQEARRGRALFLLERRDRTRSSAGTAKPPATKFARGDEAAGVADLLAPLPLLRRRRRDRRDRQADEVAVVRRIPVPVAPAAGRRQHAAADLPVDVQRRAAEILVRAQRRVDVGDAIEGVEARRRVVRSAAICGYCRFAGRSVGATPATTCV